MGYKTFPILTVARKSGLPVEDRGLRQVHINCPFCGDRRRRLYLYTDTNQFHCFNCRAHGNAVSLYARRTGLSYRDAYHELLEDSVLHFPQPAVQRPPEREPAPLAQRDAVYRAMLELLPLSAAHRDNLLTRGLTDAAILQNGYRTLGYGKELDTRCRRPQQKAGGYHGRSYKRRRFQHIDRAVIIHLPARCECDRIPERYAARAACHGGLGSLRHGQAVQPAGAGSGYPAAAGDEKSRHPMPHDGMGPGV